MKLLRNQRMNAMRPIHPGEVLKEELAEIGMTANAFAQALSVPANRITAIRDLCITPPFARLLRQAQISILEILNVFLWLKLSPSLYLDKIGRSSKVSILNGTRSITADTALRISLFFGTTPEFWLNLQTSYDLKIARESVGEKLKREVKSFMPAMTHLKHA